MKTIILLLALTLNLSAQQSVPRKANTIIVTDTLTSDQMYKKITGILFEAGYGILSTDKEQGFISTTDKSFKDGSVKLNILITEEKVMLRGEFSVPSIGSEWFPVNNSGMNNSPHKNAWNEMIKIADQIPGSKEFIVK